MQDNHRGRLARKSKTMIEKKELKELKESKENSLTLSKMSDNSSVKSEGSGKLFDTSGKKLAIKQRSLDAFNVHDESKETGKFYKLESPHKLKGTPLSPSKI